MEEKKVVFITGATSGIGKATGELLASKGYMVYGSGRKAEGGSDNFKMVAMDVRDEANVREVIGEVIAKEGGIDILINNAGVGISGAVEEIPMEAYENIFSTNVFGAVRVWKAVLPNMRERRRGLIINTTSIAGYMGLPFRGAYSASKGALMVMSESLSMEVRGFGIDVCCIAPGDVATSIATRRYHEPVHEGSAYKEAYELSLKLMNEGVDKGASAQELAGAILRIIESVNRRIHYKQAGWLEKFSIVLKRVLPDRVYEKMLMRHYGV